MASRSRNAFTWHHTSHLPDVVAGVAELKKCFEREVQVHGSAGLCQTLIAHNLVDEYRLLIFPLVLGRGKRLFGSGTVPRALRLVRTAATGSGAVMSVYRPAGELTTGSFALE